MPSKKSLKKNFFSHMRKQCSQICRDVFHLYKNFLHWNISKILISFWSIGLGVLIWLPFLILALIIWYLDPIQWLEIVSYILSWESIGLDIIEWLWSHPYWFVLMVFALVSSALWFLLASTYSLLLLARLSLHYFDKKPLKYKKNLYFNRDYIITFMGIISWNIMYLLIPVIIWAGVVFFMYLFFNIGFIAFKTLSFLVAIHTVLLIIAIIYVTYRIAFGYIILADEGKNKDLKTSRSYVKKSVKLTKWNNFFKFLFISIVYSIALLPFTSLETYLEREEWYLKDTMLYKSGLLQNLEPQQIQYYEYITSEYAHLDETDIIGQIQSYSQLRFVLFFLSYLIYSGLFVFILTSFYKRVLLKK